MKIAIASSGLGHVARGIETWAEETAKAVADEAETQTEESSIQESGFRRRPNPTGGTQDLDVTLFAGSRVAGSAVVCLPCARRGSRVNRVLTTLFSRLGGWRYGFGSDYQTEQTTFAWRLVQELRRGKFDIVHLQDPWLASLLEKARRRGRHRAKVILAHGTEESPEFLAQFDYVQHLTPWHLQQAENFLQEGREER